MAGRRCCGTASSTPTRRAPSQLLHAGRDPGARRLLPRRGLHTLDGQLHRDRRGPQPGTDRDWPGDMGWIIRIVVFIAFLIIPVVINPVTPLVTYGPTVGTYAAKYGSQIAFVQAHPTVALTAKKYQTQLANAAKFAPELAVIKADPALFTRLASYPSPAAIPPKLLAQAVAAGGGATGTKILTTISANGPAINGVIAGRAPACAAGALLGSAPWSAVSRRHRGLCGPPNSIGAGGELAHLPPRPPVRLGPDDRGPNHQPRRLPAAATPGPGYSGSRQRSLPSQGPGVTGRPGNDRPYPASTSGGNINAFGEAPCLADVRKVCE